MNVIIIGNSGSGKTTLSRRLSEESNMEVKILSLDEVAWNVDQERKPLDESEKLILEFIRSNQFWIIEGCYANLAKIALPFCTELIFLNPGVEVCVKNCLSRPWEPEKFESLDKQNEMLQNLIDWVKCYETRDDEFGLFQHQALFDSFKGQKKLLNNLSSFS